MKDDGNSTLAGDYDVNIPTITANDTFCLAAEGNCFGSGSGGTLQAAYEAGNTITATDAEGDIDLTVSEATNFSVDVTGTGSFLVQDGGSNILSVADGTYRLDVRKDGSLPANGRGGRPRRLGERAGDDGKEAASPEVDHGRAWRVAPEASP